MSLKTKLLASFREIFVYHHKSLEFRAKTYAIILASGCCDIKNCNWKLLAEIAHRVYTDKRRQEILMHTTKEYVELILRSNSSIYDEFVKDISMNIKKDKMCAKKINIDDIKILLKEDIKEDMQIFQLRLYEFLENASKEE